jgi:arylsulfatase A-like enzyme
VRNALILAARRALALACLAAASACSRPAARVVLITIDTLRADRVGARDGAPSLTPALDALARDGVSYDDAITNCSVTRCAHVSLLTGLYPWRHGVLDNSTRYEGRSLPEWLRSCGFATGAVASSLPVKELTTGFDWRHEGFPAAEAGRVSYPTKRPEQTTQAAIRFVELNRGRPFFLWVHYFPPHGPYTPPEPFLRGKLAALGPRLAVSARNYEKDRIPAYQALPGVLDADEYRRRYDAHVRYVDAFAGRLLDRLREDGLYHDALIVVTSDHGESLGEHDWYFLHGNLVYQEQSRVPLIVKRPRGALAGSRVASPVELIDVAGSIATLAGAAGYESDGTPLPGPGPARARTRYTQSNDAEVAAVYEGPWKLIWKRGPTTYTDSAYPERELFRLADDPAEARNLSATEPEQAGRLQAELLRRYATVRARPRAFDETEAQLRALGYVN